MLESILGGVASKLFGGLFQDDPMDDMRRHERQRYKWLVEGAQNAGFNPLTVLRATGGQQASAASLQSPLSARALIGQGISMGIQDHMANYDPIGDEGRRLDNELKRAQLNRYGQLTTGRRGTDFLPEGASGPPSTLPGGALTASPRPIARTDRWAMRTPWGVTAMVPSEIVRGYGKYQGDYMTMGDMADLLGETQEVLAAFQVPEIMDRLTGQGLLFDKVHRGKGEVIDEPQGPHLPNDYDFVSP